MSLYRYIKFPPKRKRTRVKAPAIISFLLIAAGSLLLVWVGWPIVSFSFIRETFLGATISPIADSGGSISTKTVAPIVLAAISETVGPVSSDFTNANAWFPTLPQKKVVTPVNSYTVSIPKLGIKDATVVIGGDALGLRLVHYGGTGLPGDYGNSVVFGHSTLPQFYNPKSYTSIFSTLPTLKEDDDVLVTYDGITYQYKVFRMVVLSPNDLSMLAQQYDDSYFTLVTCVPPGTYWQRLYVVGRLVRPNDAEVRSLL